MKKVVYIFLSVLIVTTCGFVGAYVIPGALFLLLDFVLNAGPEEQITLAMLAVFLGIAGAFFSLLPSYKLSLHLAKFVERKWGVKIDNPKKLFWLSILVPALLILLGIVL